MANSRSDDFATKEVKKTVVCYSDSFPTKFESESTTVTEPDGKVKNVSLARLHVLPDGTVWEASMDGFRRRDDLGSCIPCWRPAIRSMWRRRQSPVIKSRDAFKACVDCGRLRCADHRIESSSDSSNGVYRCLSCAVRQVVKRFCRFLFLRRA